MRTITKHLFCAALAAGVACDDGFLCFIRGTPILTPRGPRPIEELREGDEVYSWDVACHRPVVRRIAATLRGRARSLMRVAAGKAQAGRACIEGVTHAHPIFDERIGDYRRAAELTTQARLVVWTDGRDPCAVDVTEVQRWTPDTAVDVFNLTIDGPERNYFAAGILVHNKTDPFEPGLPPDEDGDGFTPPADCDDNDATIHPAANEICEDGIDNNCDARLDYDDHACPDPAGYVWSHSIGGPNLDKPTALAMTPDGGVVLGGDFSGVITVAGAGEITSLGQIDGLLLEIDASGEVTWIRQIGSTVEDDVIDVEVDADGNIFVVVDTDSAATLNDGTTLSEAGTFVSKLSSDGSHIWSRAYENTTTNDLALDANGDLYIAGAFSGVADFEGAATISSTGDLPDGFLAKIDTDGAHVWSRAVGDAGTEQIQRVDVQASGEIVVAGGFDVAFDTGVAMLVSTGTFDAFLAGLDADGMMLWARSIGGEQPQAVVPSSDQIVADMTVSASGRIGIAIASYERVDFGNGAIDASGTSGENDVFLATYEANGDLRWREVYGNFSDQVAVDIDFDVDDSLLIIGEFTDVLHFGSVSVGTPNVGAFVIRLDELERFVWGRQYDIDEGVAARILSDGAGGIVAAGSHSRVIDFGGASYKDAGVHDIWVVKLSPD